MNTVSTETVQHQMEWSLINNELEKLIKEGSGCGLIL